MGILYYTLLLTDWKEKEGKTPSYTVLSLEIIIIYCNPLFALRSLIKNLSFSRKTQGQISLLGKNKKEKKYWC